MTTAPIPALSLDARLRALIPRAFDGYSKQVLEGAAGVLADRGNPIRLNLFSVAIRMFFEHLMDGLAPAAEVTACPWFRLEPNQNKPTRKQRIQYCLQGGLSDAFVKSELSIDPAPLRKRLMDGFDNLSKHVHGRPETVVWDVLKQDAEADDAIGAIEALFDAYHDGRAMLLDPLAEGLDEGAVDTLMADVIGDLDELATHHWIDEIYTDCTEVAEIRSEAVVYRATGNVHVVLQYGSDSDYARDDGARIRDKFPFACTFRVPIDAPQDLEQAEIEAGVDTSAWWDHEFA